MQYSILKERYEELRNKHKLMVRELDKYKRHNVQLQKDVTKLEKEVFELRLLLSKGIRELRGINDKK